METEEDAAALRAISRVGAMICIEALNPVALLYHRANGLARKGHWPDWSGYRLQLPMDVLGPSEG